MILFFRSSISKIDKIEISGNHYLTIDDVKKALKVQVGDQFFGTSQATMIDRLEQLDTIAEAAVSKKFPGYLHITITEEKTVAFQLSAKDGKLMAILAKGNHVIPQTHDYMLDKPVLTGWDKQQALMNKLCAALAQIPDFLLSDLSEIKPVPSVAYPDKIVVYTKSKFEITTSIGHLPQKVEYLSAVIEGQEPGKIIMLEADTYIPYGPIDLDREASDSEKDTTH